MLYPAFFDDDFFDDFDRAFAPAKNPLYGRHAKNMMKTDIRETEDAYILDLELPGFKKDEISVRLENGYLTVGAEKAVEENGSKSGKILRKERYEGSLERSFYVGESVRPEEISASYENGVLQLSVPKRTAQKDPEKRTIEQAGALPCCQGPKSAAYHKTIPCRPAGTGSPGELKRTPSQGSAAASRQGGKP